MNRRLFLSVLLAAGAASACRAQTPASESASNSAMQDLMDASRATAAAAQQFMQNNARQPGVRTLPSGVQYRVVTSGPADGARPGASDEVKVHYEGALTDGTVFDSSFQRGTPAIMPLEQLIPAWQEVVPMMRRGDEWTVWVPPSQGYGREGRPPVIPPDAVLVFRLQLIDFLPGSGAA